MLGKVGSIALRVLQLTFAALVLGLSINAVKWQYYNSVPATSGFATFAGAFGVLASLLGLASIYIAPIAGLSMSTIDWLATIFFLAGGIAFAVGVRGVNCSDGDDEATWHNRLISGGCKLLEVSEDGDQYQCGLSHPTGAHAEHRCHLAKADTVFLFLAFVASMAGATYGLHVARNKKKGSAST